MDLLEGLAIALQPENLLYVLVGCMLGMTIGVLPGLGPVTTMVLLLPFTFSMSPESAIIMLAGIYYGVMYGGTVTAVLLKIPGEDSSVVTTFDGYAMAKQGRAGPALGIAAVGSFIGGTIAVVGLTVSAGFLAGLALRVGAPEFTALTILGLTMIAFLSAGSLLTGFLSAGVGLLLALVGQDPITGTPRFTFDSPQLLGGVELLAIVVGLFGIGEILYNLDHRLKNPVEFPAVTRVWPSRTDWRQARGSIARGGVIGFVIGVLPGGGGVVSSLVSYGYEKKRAKDPSRFGKGAIEGVAGPETANNASATSAFIPLLTLGIPSNIVMAVIFGALVLQNITPGPGLIENHPDVFWGVIASMYIGNAILLLLNVPFVRLFIRLLKIPYGLLAPTIVIVSLLGIYSYANNPFHVWTAIVFGVFGFLMRKLKFEPAPLVLALVLGEIMEQSFRQSLLVSNGSLMVFFERPISAGILFVVLALITTSVVGDLRRRSSKSAVESLA